MGGVLEGRHRRHVTTVTQLPLRKVWILTQPRAHKSILSPSYLFLPSRYVKQTQNYMDMITLSRHTYYPGSINTVLTSQQH